MSVSLSTVMESDADEMIVLRRQVALVVRCEARMSAMFGVTLVYGDIHGDDGPDQQQWLAVEGEPPDRLRAKVGVHSGFNNNCHNRPMCLE